MIYKALPERMGKKWKKEEEWKRGRRKEGRKGRKRK